ncbi:MAG: hypothetical protein AAFQ78_03050, partial [Bacteroidota bacterium]
REETVAKRALLRRFSKYPIARYFETVQNSVFEPHSNADSALQTLVSQWPHPVLRKNKRKILTKKVSNDSRGRALATATTAGAARELTT